LNFRDLRDYRGETTREEGDRGGRRRKRNLSVPGAAPARVRQPVQRSASAQAIRRLLRSSLGDQGRCSRRGSKARGRQVFASRRGGHSPSEIARDAQQARSICCGGRGPGIDRPRSSPFGEIEQPPPTREPKAAKQRAGRAIPAVSFRQRKGRGARSASAFRITHLTQVVLQIVTRADINEASPGIGVLACAQGGKQRPGCHLAFLTCGLAGSKLRVWHTFI
jgi:hypothetical protein